MSSFSPSSSITSGGETATAPPTSVRTSRPAPRHAALDPPGQGGVVLHRVGVHLDRREHAGARPNLLHEGMLGKGGHRVRERTFEVEGPLAEPLPLDDVEVGEGRGRDGGVAAVGVAVAPHPGAGRPEGLGDPGSRDHGAHRQVAARDALGARHDVGLQPEAVGGEPVAAAPEPGDHLVRDEEHARSPGRPRARPARYPSGAMNTPPAPITGSQKNAATRSLPARSIAVAERLGVVPGNLDHVLDQFAVAGRVGGDARERGPGRVHAVVGLLDVGSGSCARVRPRSCQ